MAIVRFLSLCFVALALCHCGKARTYKRCELVRELRGRFPAEQIPTWTCIAYHESRYRTDVSGPPNSDGSRDHGIFQINDRYWCSPPNHGKGCGVTCAELMTDDITKAVTCVRKIYAEWQRLHNNGFRAWTMYRNCDTPAKVDPFVQGC